MVLSNEEMFKIKGGAFKVTAFAGLIGGAVVFLIGLIDGLINPQRCN